jgi:hypothetical protein
MDMKSTDADTFISCGLFQTGAAGIRSAGGPLMQKLVQASGARADGPDVPKDARATLTPTSEYGFSVLPHLTSGRTMLEPTGLVRPHTSNGLREGGAGAHGVVQGIPQIVSMQRALSAKALH